MSDPIALPAFAAGKPPRAAFAPGKPPRAAFAPASPARVRPPRARRSAGLAMAAAGALFLLGSSFAVAAPPPEGFADLVDKVKPAVVNIASTQKSTVVAQNRQQQQPGGQPGGQQFRVPPELRGSPFEDFLKRFMQPQGPGDEDDDSSPNARPGQAQTALGSGFIIDAGGYVVTNNHVVGNFDKIQVTLADGRKLDATLVGRDDKTDLAVLKVESKEALPHVDWGDSGKTRVGDWVLAVGNPFGLGGTVTAGIVSARGRDIQSGPFDDYMQIDAAINRGNSGGPSFDRNGQVIGINTAIYSPNGGSIGIGFAIPASTAKPIVDELMAHGKIDRGWLGVSVQPMTKEIAESLGLSAEKGALVAGVTKDSPAAKAGVKQGDVIRSVDGQKVDEFRDLARLIASAGPNKSVKLGVWRDSKDTTVTVALGAIPADQTASADGAAPSDKAPAATPANVLGLGLAPVTREARQRFDLPQNAKGAVVVSVQRGSAAADAGFAPGDVIIKIGDKDVAGPADVVDTVKTAAKGDRKSVLLLVQRQGNERFVALPVGQA